MSIPHELFRDAEVAFGLLEEAPHLATGVGAEHGYGIFPSREMAQQELDERTVQLFEVQHLRCGDDVELLVETGGSHVDAAH